MSDDFILEIDNVTKEFPGVVALKDVSFNVKRGEIHGICGENGAGKSTLMKILSGVYPHDTYTGKILLNGEEINFERGAIRQAIETGISIVYQELALNPLPRSVPTSSWDGNPHGSATSSIGIASTAEPEKFSRHTAWTFLSPRLSATWVSANSRWWKSPKP
jgi:energy-coupling factor transporter ATP-binding protein EcfA2